jgi:hypothetical protein
MRTIYYACLLLVLSFDLRAQSIAQCSDQLRGEHYKVVLGRLEDIKKFIDQNQGMICARRCDCKNYSRYHVFYRLPEDYNYTENIDWLHQHMERGDKIELLCSHSECDTNYLQDCKKCVLSIEMSEIKRYNYPYCWIPLKRE